MRGAELSLAGIVVLILLLSGMGLTACGATPELTPLPTDTPLPTGTLRPTYTPTVLARATHTAMPTAESPVDTASPQASQTAAPTRTGGRTPEPSPTPPEETPTPAATRAAGPPPELSGTLYFPIFDTTEQTYHIYRLDLDAGQLDIFIERASQPAITADGERIAWRSWNHEQRGLLSRPIDGADIWQMIRFNEAGRPDWAPNGQNFVFPSRQEPDRISRLYLYTGVSEEEPFIEIQRHGSPVIGRTPAFLPDGRIVYQGCVEDLCGLYVMGVDGTNPQRLTEFEDDTAPAVSPDGTKIAYMSKVSGYWQVNVINVDGTGQHHLTDDWYWNGLPAWSPDGEQIIFVSTRDENWPDNFVLSDNAEFRLWLMDADGENQRQLDDAPFRLDGVPAGVAGHEAGGWIEERMVWMP